MWRAKTAPAPSLEEVRKRASLLIIDDHSLPPERLFTRDGYHIRRWPKVENLSQLTDGHFDLILLDLHGVGLNESPERQGLGILEHIKQTNPAQIVIAYSAQPWNISNRDYFSLADSVLDKGEDYIDFKRTVDELLLRRASPGFFVNKMNRELGDQAALVPKAVPKAIRAMQKGSVHGLQRHLEERLPDSNKVQTIVAIINVGIAVIRMI